MNPVRRAGLRLEMAHGRMQHLAQAQAHPGELTMEEATLELEGSRNLFRQELEKATGTDAQTVARLLSL